METYIDNEAVRGTSPERTVKSLDDANDVLNLGNKITDFRHNNKHEVKMVDVLETIDCKSGSSNDVGYESLDEGTNCPASMQQAASIRSHRINSRRVSPKKRMGRKESPNKLEIFNIQTHRAIERSKRVVEMSKETVND